MKKLAVLIGLVLMGSFAQANLFDNEVTVVEASQALLKCRGAAGELDRIRDQYISSVVGEHQNISDGVDQKTYTFTSQTGGSFGGPPAETVATLIVTAKVTQSKHAVPASVTWTCDIK
ncbi:MAG: hypothetical protein A2622_10795 [Bdellovibrionales bacterium RIFCSPHIGHO2_01_FULL_40_29]|nr:MAG: hypothetical protein A2622_10795 [Bdellovibrionales bacterium RIFCSPHIGHO2_01_FULL_40_29]OFZ34443.1 MAG: hypothetical protein A3D17_01060 [Bdellovibrionales bacterium RIFCSPHIGHO2_02_FULL_40_15]